MCGNIVYNTVSTLVKRKKLSHGFLVVGVLYIVYAILL